MTPAASNPTKSNKTSKTNVDEGHYSGNHCQFVQIIVGITHEQVYLLLLPGLNFGQAKPNELSSGNQQQIPTNLKFKQTIYCNLETGGKTKSKCLQTKATRISIFPSLPRLLKMDQRHHLKSRKYSHQFFSS